MLDFQKCRLAANFKLSVDVLWYERVDALADINERIVALPEARETLSEQLILGILVLGGPIDSWDVDR